MTMTALELYQQDLALRERGSELSSRQQYYIELRDLLHAELAGDGYSPLLEELYHGMRQKTMKRIYVLDYAALMECFSLIVKGQRLRDAAEFIPHLRQGEDKVPWSMLDKPSGHTMRVSEDILDKAGTLRSVCHQVFDARADGFVSDEETASRQELEQVQGVARRLNERCMELEKERDELQARVTALEEGVIGEHVRRRIEARRAREEAALQAEYAAKREQAEEVFRAHYAEQMAQRAREQEAEDRAAATRLAEVTQAYTELRRALREDLTRWQQDLDRTECRMLAATYAALHALLTDDVDALAASAQVDGASRELTEGLDRLQVNARARLRQLEQAMLRLGLTVLRPDEGDAFDPALHQSACALEPGETAGSIARCVRPGVMMMSTGEALVRAQIDLEE